MVLLLLASRPGTVVTREEIQAKIWGQHTYVDFEHSLNFCINHIRTALGDNARKPKYLETLPRRGYRLCTQVDFLGTSPDLIWRMLPFKDKSNSHDMLLSILPFQQLGEGQLQSWLPDALLGALTGNLARVPGIVVLARAHTEASRSEGHSVLLNSAGACRDHVILNGSIVQCGGRSRIRVQLVEATTDRILWAEVYVREGQDVMSVADEVAETITSEVKIHLSARNGLSRTSRSDDLEADASCLRGRYYWNKRTPESLRRAVDYFESAISQDPSYAEAYAGVADCYAVLGGYDLILSRECFPKAKRAAMKALELNPELAAARATLGFIRFFYDWDWSGAEREFKRAIELDPNHANAHHWYSLCLAALGQLPRAQLEIKKAQHLDPVSLIIDETVGWIFHFTREFDRAIECYRQTLELDPSFFPAYEGLGLAFEQKCMSGAAIRALKLAVTTSGGSPRALASLAHAYGRSRRSKKARMIFDELTKLAAERYVSSYDVALIYIGLGDRDRAMECLQRAFLEHSAGLIWLKVEPRLDCLRGHSEFQQLLSRVGLESDSRAAQAS